MFQLTYYPALISSWENDSYQIYLRLGWIFKVFHHLQKINALVRLVLNFIHDILDDKDTHPPFWQGLEILAIEFQFLFREIRKFLAA